MHCNFTWCSLAGFHVLYVFSIYVIYSRLSVLHVLVLDSAQSGWKVSGNIANLSERHMHRCESEKV